MNNTFTLERNNYRRKLIMLVKQHPILWNKTQENYNRNRPQKILAWHQISQQLDISVDKLRRTWENLRDQYRRDLKREVRFGFKSKWRFFSDMDFIRSMVSCKDECKEHETTDSDSELDVADNIDVTTPCKPSNTTLVTSTDIQTITTPSTISCNNARPANILPFQPIVLTKQWQALEKNLPQACNTPRTSSYCTPNTPPRPAPIDIVKLPRNWDSSTDCRPLINSEIPYENIAKEEPELQLETDNGFSVVEKPEPPTFRKDNQNSGEFQEPCVSTSSNKRLRTSTSIEEISDTSTPSNSRSQIKIEADLNAKDDDYYFVMSLLPSLRQIPRNRKFPLRIGIMSLIAKDLEEVCKE